MTKLIPSSPMKAGEFQLEDSDATVLRTLMYDELFNPVLKECFTQFIRHHMSVLAVSDKDESRAGIGATQALWACLEQTVGLVEQAEEPPKRRDI